MSTEKCPNCRENGILIKTEEKNSRLTIKHFSCGHQTFDSRLPTGVPLVYIMTFPFTLDEPVSFSSTTTDSDEVKLIFAGNPQMLTGFTITIKIPISPQTSGTIDISHQVKMMQKANRFLNFLSLKTGQHMTASRPRISNNPGIIADILTLNSNLTSTNPSIDLTNSNLTNLLDSNSQDSKQLAHFNRGLQDLNSGNYGNAIREFHQVIENENISGLEDYKFLRHGVSHEKLSNNTTIQSLINRFDLEFETTQTDASGNITEGYVPFDSLKNDEIFEKEALFLRNKVFSFLDNKFSNF